MFTALIEIYRYGTMPLAQAILRADMTSYTPPFESHMFLSGHARRRTLKLFNGIITRPKPPVLPRATVEWPWRHKPPRSPEECVHIQLFPWLFSLCLAVCLLMRQIDNIMR